MPSQGPVATPKATRSPSAPWESATTNFYNNAFERKGYGDDVRAVQRLWLAGDRDGACRRVSTAIGLGTNLIGTDDMIRERLPLYRHAGIGTLRVNPAGPTCDDLDPRLDDLGRLLLLVREVNDETATRTRANLSIDAT